MENNKTVELNEKKRRALDRLYRLSFFFSNEMLKYEEKHKEFEKKCKEAEESGETVIIVSASSNNAKCMKNCLQATNKVIDYLNKKENADYIELWQLDGVNAMLDKSINAATGLNVNFGSLLRKRGDNMAYIKRTTRTDETVEVEYFYKSRPD